jgi:hypothetical protein
MFGYVSSSRNKFLDKLRNAQDGQYAGPAEYRPPVLMRWGTLRELTEGGGGFKMEPGGGGRRTRF